MNRREFIQSAGMTLLATALPEEDNNEILTSQKYLRTEKIRTIKPDDQTSFMLLGYYSGGIEPRYDLSYIRRVKVLKN